MNILELPGLAGKGIFKGECLTSIGGQGPFSLGVSESLSKLSLPSFSPSSLPLPTSDCPRSDHKIWGSLGCFFSHSFIFHLSRSTNQH